MTDFDLVPAFWIKLEKSLYQIVNGKGEAICPHWFTSYSDAHAHCEDEHGEVIGDWKLELKNQ